MPYKVLVVDDSAFMRKIITDLVQEDPEFQVVRTAKNGKEAVDLASQLELDVITMDVEMPGMNGLEAVRAIMASRPTPIVMLSSLTKEGALETIRGLESGAVDFIQKPSGSISLDLYKVGEALREKLRVAAATKVQSMKPLPSPPAPVRKAEPAQNPALSGKFRDIVFVGTSTGGPRALHTLLSGIPADFPAPILVVQHMPPNFTRSLAQRLDMLCPLHIVEAAAGEPVLAGVGYIAPGGWHMHLEKGTGGYRIGLNQSEPRSSHRPSVDELFESTTPFGELRRHYVLMTGMGSDGARGMLAAKQKGAVTTIAESEETCVVYGMPRSAVELGCVTHVVPLHDIAAALCKAVQMNAR